MVVLTLSRPFVVSIRRDRLVHGKRGVLIQILQCAYRPFHCISIHYFDSICYTNIVHYKYPPRYI